LAALIQFTLKLLDSILKKLLLTDKPARLGIPFLENQLLVGELVLACLVEALDAAPELLLLVVCEYFDLHLVLIL
jgi:hypothetical protein